MRYVEWIFLFVLSGLGIGLANFVGFEVGFAESLPGILLLLGISLAGVVASRLIPLKLPVVAYVSVIGLLVASPLCPAREFVCVAGGNIYFTAPLTMVGAYAGISIGDQVRTFLKQGWKMILIGIFVMTGTFICSAAVSQIVMQLTGTI